jgi:hypothetical protein
MSHMEVFRHVHVFRTSEEVEGLTITRQPLWNNKKGEKGPFDVIGDVQGCLEEAIELLSKLDEANGTREPYAQKGASPVASGLQSSPLWERRICCLQRSKAGKAGCPSSS